MKYEWTLKFSGVLASLGPSEWSACWDALCVSHPIDLPLSESDLSEDMLDPWLLFLILSVPLCSCSSRTRSSLCSQSRRPFSCSARSSCSCSFWNEEAGRKTSERRTKPHIRRTPLSTKTSTLGVLCSPLCGAGLAAVDWGWCSSWSQTTGGLVSWAAPGSASTELVYTTQQVQTQFKTEHVHHWNKSTSLWHCLLSQWNMNYLFFSSSLWTDLRQQEETYV